jgi:hypothetical protein
MGQGLIFLTLDRLAFGVDRLLGFMNDRAAVESLRPPTPPDGAIATHTAIEENFGDGTTFQLLIRSHLLPTSEASSVDPVIRQLLATILAPSFSSESEPIDLRIELIWNYSELPPPSLRVPCGEEPNPKLVSFLMAAQGWTLHVDVCEGCYPWIDPKGNSELRKVRSILDRYAKPRLILPERDSAGFRDDFIALIALFAAKAQCLAPRDDQLPTFFRSYCDRFFGREREWRKLSEAAWHGIVDQVFQRLYCGQAGRGFTMPVLTPSFRAYIAQAIRGQAANELCRTRPVPKPGRFPSSINQAAAQLGVSHMTVRRCMSRLHRCEWTEETWLAVSAELADKKQWQELTAQLQKEGLSEDAARKRVQRYKRGGLTPNEARRQNSSPESRKGTCTACGEEQAVGELYQGKFYCGECYREKMEISLTE